MNLNVPEIIQKFLLDYSNSHKFEIATIYVWENIKGINLKFREILESEIKISSPRNDMCSRLQLDIIGAIIEQYWYESEFFDNTALQAVKILTQNPDEINPMDFLNIEKIGKYELDFSLLGLYEILRKPRNLKSVEFRKTYFANHHRTFLVDIPTYISDDNIDTVERYCNVGHNIIEVLSK